MRNELMVFEGVELEILTKEDVRIEFNGELLFNGRQVAEILGYKRPSDCINDNVRVNQKYKVKNSDTVNDRIRKLNNAGETFITEKAVMKLIINSNMPKADEFEDKVWEIINEVQKTGRYDVVEQGILKIEDEEERNLTLTVYRYEQALKINPNDLTTICIYNNKKTELDLYKKDKQLEIVNSKVQLINDKVEEVNNKIKKATVLREGDMSPEAIAKKFNVFSLANKPHNQFADNLARDIGIWVNPQGNIGYQDEYISINLSPVGGQTVATIKYSQKAYEEMKEYIEGGNLIFETPPTYFKRGDKKGKFNYCKIIFSNGKTIKANETTYKIYNEME